MIQKFSCSRCDFVRNKYYSSQDRHKLSNDELNEFLTYKNISKEFDYNDWYGSSTRVKVTFIGAVLDAFNDIIVTMKSDHYIPVQYFPTPSQVLNGKGLLFPIGVGILTN